MYLSRFRVRPPAALVLALFGLLPLAWKASQAAPERIAAPAALRAHSAPRPHGAPRPHDPPTGGPPTAIPLYAFTGLPDGLNPQGRLLQVSGGDFYGVTARGGSFGFGSIYRLTPDGKETVLASFPETQGGPRYPSGPLVEGLNTDGTPNGAFYGVTAFGGDTGNSGEGSVYLFAADAGSPTGFSITRLYSFTGGADGGLPLGALTVGRKADGTPDGYLYGTTLAGGIASGGVASGGGVVFRVPKDGLAEDVLHTFQPIDSLDSVNNGGSLPRAALLQRHDATGWGRFFGTTTYGGAGGHGTVFSLTSAGAFVTLHDFQDSPSSRDGRDPEAGLVQSADGALYGTTFAGGIGAGGTVYRLAPDAGSSTGFTYSQIASMGIDTRFPKAALIEASDGKLYGTSEQGGSSRGGSVFRIDADTSSATGYSATAVHVFTYTESGGSADSELVQGTDGDLYGVTIFGGTNSDGTIYRLNVVPRKAPAPTITGVIYHHYDSDGSTNVSVTGTGIAHGATLTISDYFDGTAGAVVVDDAAHIHADLTKALPPGNHEITVANADGQSASTELTAYGKPRIDGAVAITHPDGTVTVLVSGINFPANGYNGSDFGMAAGVFDPVAGQFLPLPAVSGRSQLPGAQAPQVPQQFSLDLGAVPGGPLLVGVLSADGQVSGLQLVGTPSVRARGGSKAGPHATTAGTPTVIYNKDRTQYHVSYESTYVDTGDFLNDLFNHIFASIADLLFQLYPSANASPTQLLPGATSLVHDTPSSLITTEGQTTAVVGLISQDVSHLISPDAAQLISQETARLISQDGGGLISQDGGGLLSHNRGTLIGQDGASVISNDGGSVISNDGGSLISQDGGGVLYTRGSSASLKGSASGRAASAASAAHPAVIVGLLGAVGSGPGFGGKLKISTPPKATRPASGARAAAVDAPGSFTLTHTDEGPEHGVGPTDAVVTGDDGNGHEIVLLRLTFTPGQPDTLDYVAPGVVVTPAEGTPAPRLSNPAPTLLALSPSTVLVGSPDLTLSVVGTLFTSGTVVNWNGTPLVTTVLSGKLLTAVVPAALLSAAGTAQVTVANPAPGGESAALPFVVAAPPAPTLTALTPNTALAGSPDLTLAAAGTLFAPGAVINWNGKPLATTVVSGTQATAVVPAALLNAAGTAQVTVANPAPGGESAALPFVIAAPTAPPAPLHTFPAGLQMLSVTEDYTKVGLSAALSDSTHPMVVWNPATGVYDAHADMHPGVGYWVRLSKAADLLDTGAPPPATLPFPIPLKAGWNMIGDPFPSPVALSSLTVQDAIGTTGTFRQAVSGGVVSGTLYAYPAGSTQYRKVGQDGSLTPFDGEWIYAFRDCTLLVPAR